MASLFWSCSLVRLRHNAVTMKFFWDRSLGTLRYQIATPPIFVFGNTAAEVEVNMTSYGAPLFLEGTWEIYFAIRNPSIFSEAPLADLASFSLRSGNESIYVGNIDLSGDTFEEFMAESPSKDIIIQFTLTTGESDTVSSQAIPAIAQNYTANPALTPP